MTKSSGILADIRELTAFVSAKTRCVLSASWCITLICGLGMATGARAQEQPPWPDTFLTRLEALALIQTLNAEILGSRSATKSLEKWCRDHDMADDAKILAHLIQGVNKAPTEEQMQHLMIANPEEVKYRRVQLQCGDHVLSQAENWYVPSRLSPEINHLLETSDIPFGKAVQSLQPYRRTFAAKMLWSPLADGWERKPNKSQTKTKIPLFIPEEIFAHNAILYTGDHMPFAEVSEIYQREILAFPPPRVR